MPNVRGLLQQLRVVLRFSKVEDDLAAELQDHFEREVERQLASGASAGEARREAALRMGNVEALKEHTRDERGGRLVTDALNDLRVGWRGLRRDSGFTLAVVLSLSLGVAGVTAIFSIVNAVLLRPLAYPDANQLHLVRVAWNEFTASLSAADFLRLRDESRGIATIGAYWLNLEGFTLLDGASPEVVPGANVTFEAPRVLGVVPVLGRWLSEEAGTQEVLISTELWRNRFGAAHDVIGRPLTLDGTVYTIVGVMPPGFNVPGQSNGAIWVGVPIREPSRRGPYWLRVIARLEPGIGSEQAASRLTANVTPVLLDRYRAEPSWRYIVTPMKDEVIGDVGSTLWLFLAAVSLVLLLACVNAANLMLARGVTRTRELSVRSSLGARRGRLVRQLLAETSLLGVISGVLALAGASILVSAMVSSAGALLPRVHEVRVDAVAAMVAVAVALSAALCSSVAPALWLTGRRLGEALRDGGRGASEGPRQGRTRRLMVAAEVAVTLTVLIATTLLIKTMIRLEREDPGFDANGVLSFRLALPPDPYRDQARLAQFLQTVEDELRGLPGVAAVAFAESLPPNQLQQSNNYTLVGHEPGSAGRSSQGSGVAQWNVVTPAYFETLGIRLRRGRLLNSDDHLQAPRAALVSESFAHKHFGAGDPLGQRFKGGDWDAAAPWTTIVGVVADVPYERGVWGGISPTIYVPYAQNPGSRWHFVVLKAAGAENLAVAASSVVQRIDPSIPLRDVMTMSERLRMSAAVPRFRMILFTLLAVVALTLAITGIYGVLTYHVNQRRRETAIRRALGARSAVIVSDVVGSGLRLTAVGTMIGLASGGAAVRGLSSFLYGVEANDVGAFAGSVAILATAAMLATAIPAARAVQADPLSILREE